MTNNYTYYNINPSKAEEQDCVCRAISLATRIPYNTINKLLELTSKAEQCDKLCVCCYHTLLEDVFAYPVKFCVDGETVGDIAHLYSNNVVLVRINGHLTACLYGVCYDIWDCTKKKADCFWIVE